MGLLKFQLFSFVQQLQPLQRPFIMPLSQAFSPNYRRH